MIRPFFSFPVIGAIAIVALRVCVRVCVGVVCRKLRIELTFGADGVRFRGLRLDD